jgi:hypothetical protein
MVALGALYTNQIARNQEFSLSTLHTVVKVQRPLQFNMITFWKKAKDSRRKFGLDGNGNPNYGREDIGFFH